MSAIVVRDKMVTLFMICFLNIRDFLRVPYGHKSCKLIIKSNLIQNKINSQNCQKCLKIKIIFILIYSTYKKTVLKFTKLPKNLKQYFQKLEDFHFISISFEMHLHFVGIKYRISQMEFRMNFRHTKLLPGDKGIS